MFMVKYLEILNVSKKLHHLTGTVLTTQLAWCIPCHFCQS